MKTLKTTLTLLTFALLTISCNSDDDNKTEPVGYSEESPLDVYMALLGFDQKIIVREDVEILSEIGVRYKPTVKDNVNSFSVKIPDENPSLRVVSWDAGTKTIFKSENINVSMANVSVKKAISPIAFTKDK